MRTKIMTMHICIGMISIALFAMGKNVAAADLANSYVDVTVKQPDEKIVIGGNFTLYNNIVRNYIARINADGTLDTSFDPGVGPNGRVFGVALQSDGKIMVVGSFTTYSGIARKYIARINADGTLDTSFDPGVGPNWFIDALTVQSDGKILIGGTFTSYAGTTRNRIARLNADGTLDMSFDPYTDVGQINTIAVRSDGKIIIGGHFNIYNSFGHQMCVTQLNADGTEDVGFTHDDNIGVTMGGVRSMMIQSDGKIIIAGSDFTVIHGGVTSVGFGRLNADGTVDNSFAPGSGINSYLNLYALQLQSDGKIMLGGNFTLYNGTSVGRIVRINTDGSLDASFNVGAGTDSAIRTVTVLSDNKVVTGGYFTIFDGIPMNYITRLNTDGSLDTTFGEEPTIITPTLPASTPNPTNVTATTAQGNGEITDTGGEDPERFIEWGTTSGIYTDNCTAGTGGAGTYACQMTALLPNTTYYVRAYATNTAGTSYSAETSFTTAQPSQDTNLTLTATIAENMTLTCGSDIDIDNGTTLIPGTPLTNTTTCIVTTNDSSGYDLQLTNDRGTSNTLYHDTLSTDPNGQIPDKPRWDPNTPNAQAFTDTGLAFGILSSTATKNDAWWGTATNCTDTNQLYAGIPDTTTDIMRHESYSNTHTDTTICYQVNVPSTQIAGEYTGSVTYTATGRP